MKTFRASMLLAVSLISLSSVVPGTTWASLPSFDWRAALVVGGIVALATGVVIVAAIATPFIAIQGGATILGTALAVGAIALGTGVIGGMAAGFYWGRQGDIKRQEQIENIKHVSNQLDILFEASADDPSKAARFQCTLVVYEATNLASSPPTVTLKKLNIVATNSEDFYGQVNQEMKRWFTNLVAADAAGRPRRVVVYMNPYPGEGVYERLKEMAENNGIRKCIVNKVNDRWVSAIP